MSALKSCLARDVRFKTSGVVLFGVILLGDAIVRPVFGARIAGKIHQCASDTIDVVRNVQVVALEINTFVRNVHFVAEASHNVCRRHRRTC